MEKFIELSENQRIRIALSDFGRKGGIDIRRQFKDEKDEKDEWLFTKKGVLISKEHIKAVIAAIREVSK